jgi:hypothetical protein
MTMRPNKKTALQVGSSAILGAVIGASLSQYWLIREREDRAREIKVLTEIIEKHKVLEELQAELQRLPRKIITDADGGIDAGIRLKEFIDFSDPDRPIRQLCECDSMNRCRCF